MQSRVIRDPKERLFRLTGYAILLLLLVYRLLLVFTYNGEIGGIDNNFVYGVIRNLAGYNIYPDPSLPPFSVNPYAPLYFELNALAGKLFGVDTENPISVYRLCRMTSIICDVITCFILFRTLKRVAASETLLLVAGFASIICFLGYTFSRADSLMLTFFASFLYFLVVPAQNFNYRNLILLGLFGVLCMFAKQNGIITLILGIAWLWRAAQLRAMMIFIAAFVITTALLYVFFTQVRGFDHLLDHTIMAIDNRIDLRWFYLDIFKRFADSLLLIPLVISVSISVNWLLKERTRFKSTLGLIFIIQTIFSLGASLKWGASAGYFNESFVLSIIIIGIWHAELHQNDGKLILQRTLAMLIPLGLIFVAHTLIQGYLFFLQGQDQKRSEYHKQIRVREALKDGLNDQYVLDLGNQNTNFFKNIFYRNAIVPNFDAVNCCTLPDGNFDYSGLKEMISGGQIGYIILPAGDSLRSLWNIAFDGYRLDTVVESYQVYSSTGK